MNEERKAPPDGAREREGATERKTSRIVGDWMTPLPATIGSDQSISFASTRMHEIGVRHLPVMQRGSLVGVISQRDIALIEGLPGVDPLSMTVAEGMTGELFTCSRSEDLEIVAREMAERRIGSVIVVENGKPAGIFTTVDALRALAELLSAPRAQRRSAS